jgi:hypothetical protein
MPILNQIMAAGPIFLLTKFIRKYPSVAESLMQNLLCEVEEGSLDASPTDSALSRFHLHALTRCVTPLPPLVSLPRVVVVGENEITELVDVEELSHVIQLFNNLLLAHDGKPI